MKKISVNKKIAGLAAVAVIISTASTASIAWAHGGATGIVKERMDLMSAIGKKMKMVASMVKGETEFDGSEISKAAAQMSEHAGKINKLFPEGSLQMHSEALPTIWTNWDRFTQLSDDLVVEAKKLSEVASSGDKRAVMMQFANTGKVCSTCHTDFRKKED
jgi:cytochrome c556